jgi:hypothetical protein
MVREGVSVRVRVGIYTRVAWVVAPWCGPAPAPHPYAFIIEGGGLERTGEGAVSQDDSIRPSREFRRSGR